MVSSPSYSSGIQDHPEVSFIVVSHTSKNGAQDGDHAATRGASSLGDNSRFGLALTWATVQDGKDYDIKDIQSVIKMTHTKSSYSVVRPPVFFTKNQFGVPVMLDVENARAMALRNALDVLVDILRAEHPDGIHKRGIERGIGDPPKLGVARNRAAI